VLPRDDPSRRLVAQRIRNRIIEHLQLTASFDDQLQLQSDVPFVRVPAEVINGWEDWMPGDPRLLEFAEGVYTPEEVVAIIAFHDVWDSVADRTPDPLPSLRETQALPEWRDLRDSARQALAVLLERGPFPDDIEIGLD
jgi:hypothetical protein